MPDMLINSSAGDQVRLFLEWTQDRKNRCTLTHVRCVNNHPTASATYTANYKGNTLDTRTFPAQTTTRLALPNNVTLPMLDGEPDMVDLSTTYSGPGE
jgi:hypothetical protein